MSSRICGDALQTPFRARSFDLVSMQYPALRKAAGEAAVRLLDALTERGTGVAVVSSSRNAPEVLEASGLAPRFEVVVDGSVAAGGVESLQPHAAPGADAARRYNP